MGSFFINSDKVPKMKHSELVYRINRKDCDEIDYDVVVRKREGALLIFTYYNLKQPRDLGADRRRGGKKAGRPLPLRRETCVEEQAIRL